MDLNGIVEGSQDKFGVQRIGDGITKDKTTVPVNKSRFVEESSFHRYIGDVSAPDLVRIGDFNES